MRWPCTTPNLYIRDGSIIGSGTITGNLVLGYAITDFMPNTTPIISPGGGVQLGVINVTGNFRMYSGKMDIEVNGPNPNNIDQIIVGGNFDLTGGPANATLGLFVNILPVHSEIGPLTKLTFMQYANLNGDFNPKQMGISDPAWTIGSTANAAPVKSTYWVQSPNVKTPANLAKVGGILWQGANALANTFVPGVDTLLANVGVNLFAADGTTLIASTTSDANGYYEFDNLDPGPYVVKFAQATQERFVQLGGQSLADPSTGTVPINVFEDTTNIDAGYFYDAAPIAVNDNYNAHLNTPVTGNVLANDSDPEGDTLTATLATGPQNGVVLLNPNGTFVYTPNSNFSGTDTFTYTASDGFGGKSTATVTITVASTSAPTSASVDYTTPYTLDTTAADGVLAGESDPSGDTLTAVLADGPANGALTLNSDGTFSYVPNDNFVGTDSFRFYATDAGGPGNLTTVNIQVTDHPPVANPTTPTTNQDTPLTFNVLANDTDPDTSDTLTVVGVSNGVYGTASLNADGTITYSPAAGWSGTDTFSYVISDSSGRLAESTVTVTVNALPGAPVVSQGSISTLENTSVSIDLRTLVTSSQSPASSLTYTISDSSNGTVSLAPDGYTATFTPAPGYFGPASFSFLATDPANGIKTASAVAVNVLPIAANVSASTNENSSVTISVPNNASPDGDTLTVLAASNGANGTVAVNADGTITFSPPSNWYGSASFSYWAVDAYGDIAEGTVSVTVNALPPTAKPGSLTTQQGISVGIDLSSLASDVNMPSANLTYSVSGAQGGTVTLMGTTAQFTPASGFTGQASFTYTVTDPATGLSASSTVTVTVNGSGGTGNSPPLATGYTATASSSPITLSIQALASDPNGYSLTIISVTQGTGGTVTIAPDGQSLTYTGPYPSSTDSFTYTVSDGHGGTATGIVSIYP